MQTKFKWTDKQRLYTIGRFAYAAEICPLEMARTYVNDIIFIIKCSADEINNDKAFNLKLEAVFALQKMITGSSEFYDSLIKLEQESETDSFAA